MKSISIKLFTAAVVAVFFMTNLFSQNASKIITDTIKVKGNCEMCKTSIEKAAKVPGVTKAVWDQKKKILVLSYDSSKVKNMDVQKKVAAVGYDTESVKADSKVYNSLPGCCKYER